MEIIKSKTNGKIKYIRSLNTKKGRDEENAFVVEGIKFVDESIKENADLILFLFSESSLQRNDVASLYNSAIENGTEAVICQDDVFDSAADTVNAQGVLTVVKKRSFSHAAENHKFAIMCDRIQDPGNLGTIIRTADAFGPAVIILNKGCADVYNPKVVRASAGAIFRVDFIYSDSDEKMLEELKNAGFKIVSTVVESDYTFEDMEKSEKICVVIGNEGQGVSREIADNSHMKITIKMPGRAESLNASIAAGISIYEIRKKLL